MKKVRRFIEIITGFNYIHHIYYSYGYKFPFMPFGYFKKYGIKYLNSSTFKDKDGNMIKKIYHNCTLTGTY